MDTSLVWVLMHEWDKHTKYKAQKHKKKLEQENEKSKIFLKPKIEIKQKQN